MASHRPLEDQSLQVQRFRRSYGGSDRTSPFFRYPEYVKYNSLEKAKDLGTVSDLRASLSGAIGGITGTNTHFFRFTLRQPSRIGARLIHTVTARVEEIAIRLADAKYDGIPLGPSGYVEANYNLDTTPLMPPGETAETITVISVAKYVTSGYWEKGYTFEFSVIETSTGELITETLQDFVSDLLAAQQPGAASFDEFAAMSSTAAIMPAGQYILTLTTDEWQETPYQLQLITIPQARELDGSASFSFAPAADSGVRQIAGDALIAFEPYARLKETIDLGPDDADLAFQPRLELAVTTPLG